MRPVALVGLRGAGKTTVGRLVAAALGWTFVDLDDLVVARAGRSIAALIEAGKPAFRDLEQSALSDALATREPLVLATGGGVVLRPANRELLRARAFVVHLVVAPEVAAARVAADPRTAASRPPLRPGGPLAEARALFAERGPLYAEVSHAVLDASASPETLAAAVVDLVRSGSGEASRRTLTSTGQGLLRRPPPSPPPAEPGGGT